MKLPQLKDKKILILGFGREGEDSYLALRKLFPNKVLGIADELESKKLLKRFQKYLKLDKKLELYFGKNYLNSLKNYDLIIKTPGIPLKILEPFLKKNQKLTSQTEIFFDNCPSTIVGVTGTKGKGTCASLIYQILKKGGKKVQLIGNIGKPVFQALLRAKKDDVFVYELSSHQLQNLKKSPRIAVFLNLYPAHLDFFKNFSEYKRAKENIIRWQSRDDFLIYNSEQKILREIAKKAKAKKIPFNGGTLPGGIDAAGERICPLIGKFNLLNVAAAVRVGELFNIPEEKIIKAIKEFKPLPHRLEFVGCYRGIAFFNDSLATIPQSTMAALGALGEKVETLILGGSESEVDFFPLARKILERKIQNLIFLSPGTGEKIWQKIKSSKNKKVPVPFFAGSMKEAVKMAYQKTNRGKVCLLSPGAPSFNLFQDYQERGNLFKKFVKKYSR